MLNTASITATISEVASNEQSDNAKNGKFRLGMALYQSLVLAKISWVDKIGVAVIAIQ